jgi:hypothetical protein
VKTWVLTGWSPKRDGFLFVVEGETVEDAIKYIANNYGMIHRPFNVAGVYYDIICPADAEITDEEVEAGDGGDMKWAYIIFSQELVVGCNHPDAVNW